VGDCCEEVVPSPKFQAIFFRLPDEEFNVNSTVEELSSTLYVKLKEGTGFTSTEIVSEAKHPIVSVNL
jgi:hypothetical protein